LTIAIFLRPNTIAAKITTEELLASIRDLKGTDDRIDATQHTAERQQEGGPCDNLPQATASLVEEPDDDDDDDDLRKRALCEYTTWCITNNPHQRAVFDEAGGGTRSRGGDSRVGVSVDFGGGESSHLHRRVFANERNHPSFIRAGTVQALADVIVKSATAETLPPLAVRSMWAMAALRNLEASYCDREDDGRC